MALSALLDRMRDIVQDRRAARMQAAREEARALIERAREAAHRRREDAESEMRNEAVQALARARQRAEAQAEREVLTLRDRVVDTALSLVRKRIAAIAESPEFGAILEALLAEVVVNAPADAVIEAPPGRAEECRHWLDAHGCEGMEVVENTALTDGVLLSNRERTYRVSNTLSTRFQRIENLARMRCMRRLFGAQGEPDAR